MTVLVFGAAGFIGAPLVRALRARGREVVAVSRGGAGPDGVACDRRDLDRVIGLVRERRVRTIIDLLAYVEADTLPLFDALGGLVERYVMASSADVYRNYEGLHRKADPPPIIEPLSEQSPLRGGRHPYRVSPRRLADASDAWLDDYDKIPLEAALRRAAFTHVILRLPMVYGPGDRQQRFRWVLSPMLRGRDLLTVDPAWAAWRTTYGFVDDVADAMARAADDVSEFGTFNLGAPDAPDHGEWIERFATTVGWRGGVDLQPALAESPIAGLDLRYPLVTDTRAFRATFGWSEPTSLDERLEKTVSEQRERDRS